MEFTVTELNQEEKPIIKSVYSYRGFEAFLEKVEITFGDKFKILGLKDGIVSFSCSVHGRVSQTRTSFLNSDHGCKKCNSDAKRLSSFLILEKEFKIRYPLFKLIFTKQFPKAITFRIGKRKRRFSNSEFMKKFFPVPVTPRVAPIPNTGLEKIIIRALDLHGDKFEYPIEKNQGVQGFKDTLTIVCKKHGEFTRRVEYHLSTYSEGKTNLGGCKACFQEYCSDKMEKRYGTKS